ncbi:hypothetical protein CSQ93_21595 [Janthinobacterium sp. BJB426]|uniref:hypothetical protein n=1 Tax=Janthinobacterium sp. BJB426 TaxID=2048010 RepID=UPI000C0F1E6A|nr:hypothetical protein [Janthinobacterium sp. BJB426]PHV25817.1 hypothetical protein CSQ93_21595 [Janthinobacterium sp. BJB426]
MSLIEAGYQKFFVSQAVDLDGKVAWFANLIIRHKGDDKDVTGTMDISLQLNGFDLLVSAHHRKFLLKYGHVIQLDEGKPKLYGEYKLLVVDEGSVHTSKSNDGALLTFSIASTGGITIGEKYMSCDSQSTEWQNDQRTFKREILLAIHRSLYQKTLTIGSSS